MKKFKIGIIGYGNMAKAILHGIKKSALCKCGEITFFDVAEKNCTEGQKEGFVLSKSQDELIKNSEYVFLAIKPQIFKEIAKEFEVLEPCNIISIMAGVKKEEIKKVFPSGKVARAMPNTPSLIGQGVTALDLSDFNEEMQKFTTNVFKNIGHVEMVTEEEINGVIALSGSSPAYVFQFLQGMIEKGLELGFSQDVAKNLVFNTVIGATNLAKESDKTLSELTQMVCSKGGTTIEAVKSLEKDGFKKVVKDAMTKCYERAVELSDEEKKGQSNERN